MAGIEFTAEDAGYSPEQPTPDYEQELQPQQQQQTAQQMGSQLSGWNATLRQINQLMQQLQQMGVIQGMGGQQQQPMAQQQAQGHQQPTAQAQQPQQQTGSVDQLYRQAVGICRALAQEDDLGPDATLADTEQWLIANEQAVRDKMQQYLEGQQ